MNSKFFLVSAGLASLAGFAQGQSLYTIGDEAQESMPLEWVAGLNVIWDDNPTPTAAGGGDESFALNPFVGTAFVNITPQTTIDFYARLGLTYYFDKPSALGADDTYYQARAGFNITHRVSERLRFSSRNFVAYELEPDYSYGFATTRQLGEYLYYSSDNSVGFRWSERLASYTGVRFTGLDYDAANSDRFTWEAYHSFRYQVSPQTVALAEYRYGQTDGDGLANDSTNQYLLLGVEHRLSPNTIAIVRAGAQFRDVDGGQNATSPYVEAALRSRINEQLSVRSFVRYGIEDYDTVQLLPVGPVEFSERRVLRVGLSGDYALSSFVTLFAGVDYIRSDYEEGRVVPVGLPVGLEPEEDLINLYVGFSYQINPALALTGSYNYTDSSSDLPQREYDRNRVSLGVRAEF